MARAFAVVLSLAAGSNAQAGTWDALLTNSHWYVPQENLLAYMSNSTSFTTPPPISLWDQTLWSLGTATDGRFTGASQATFYVSPELSFSSTTSILGLATESGQSGCGSPRPPAAVRSSASGSFARSAAPPRCRCR